MANTTHKVKSLSLPSKLNHINQRIEHELKKLRAKEEASTSASESIIIGVSGLAELYGCINKALSLPMTQQALSLRQHEKHVGELLKGCSSLLNVCSSIKEIVLQQGAITKELESTLSNTKDGCTNIANYNSLRKEVIRKAKDVMSSLNQLNVSIIEGEDCHLSTMIKSLRCVSIINLSVYESLLSFLSMPVSKPKRSLVSKLMNKGRRGKCESGIEINDVDMVLHELLSGKTTNEEKLCFTVGKLRTLVGVMEGMDNGLENMCKQLSETKVFLMNILSF
ncbi:hypothetical protein BVRB_6g152270 [Beta vulgaris subsp. vulgaris]|uniref:uncharacterized protein LOC104898054 n=1 Tax=Beta vulgaris subsp. vulgaris TaxID=3555 RepID=UPI00053FBBC9|nr:uncharacterized protein LOC104898054 [Beta vulgaris subsp. vulgaris]KMT06889.1 hypothetical protein BVRB_6g152270 [Beta vulgaris subsp. vulgaris]